LDLSHRGGVKRAERRLEDPTLARLTDPADLDLDPAANPY